MSRLFIELYLDEDVDVLIADLIRARGFKSSTTQEAGQKGKQDDELNRPGFSGYSKTRENGVRNTVKRFSPHGREGAFHGS